MKVETRPPFRWMHALSRLVALAVAIVVLMLAIGAVLDPTGSAFATIASSLWTTFGPHFIVAAFVALALSLIGDRHAMPRLSGLSAGVSVLALLAALAIVGTILAAVGSAGGRMDPIRGLFLSTMTEPPPDRTESMADAEGYELRAAVYLPPRLEASMPVLVYIHGGGFMIGNATETAADLRWFADRGWAVFSINYRLFELGRPTWDKAPADVACGLAWVHRNAARFGGDPRRLALLGDSAGGNLAINLAYSAALGRGHSSCGAVPQVQAVVVQYPAVDPIAIYERGFPVPGFEPQMLMRGYIGGSPGQFPERIREISSETYISDKAPPTLVIAPMKDSLVVSESVYRFVDKARAGGVDMEIVRIPFANHVYNQMARNSIGNQARLRITSAYLKRRGLAPDMCLRDAAC